MCRYGLGDSCGFGLAGWTLLVRMLLPTVCAKLGVITDTCELASELKLNLEDCTNCARLLLICRVPTFKLILTLLHLDCSLT